MAYIIRTLKFNFRTFVKAAQSQVSDLKKSDSEKSQNEDSNIQRLPANLRVLENDHVSAG